MKNTNRFLVLAAAAIFLASASQSKAQYRAVGDDGIAASPKHRQFLNESGKRMVKGTPSTVVGSVGYQATGRDGITASPKLRQMIDDSRGVASTGPTIDYAHAPRPLLSPKDPRFEAAWRENALKQHQMAPLK